jgi:hypothetical protein
MRSPLDQCPIVKQSFHTRTPGRIEIYPDEKFETRRVSVLTGHIEAVGGRIMRFLVRDRSSVFELPEVQCLPIALRQPGV